MEQRFPATEIAEAFRKHVDPGAPLPIRGMAAKGLVPMPPQELAKVVYLLTLDDDATVAASAKKTLAGLPDNILIPLLAARLPAPVLDGLAHLHVAKPAHLQKMLLNAAVSDETISFLATLAKEAELEIIADNQERLLRSPAIIESLYFNKETRMSTVDRVIDFAVRNGVTVAGIPAFKEAAEALGLEKAEKGIAPMTPIEIVQSAAEPGTLLFLTSDDTRSLFDEDEVERTAEPTAKATTAIKSGQVAKALLAMSVAQKVRWAQLGNKEVRARLLRDSNRLVAVAAIKSPRITPEEVVPLSGNKALDDEVIRIISRHREWTKIYTVRLNLVQNPKTPVQSALSFLMTLQSDHLKNIAKSRNVSNVVSVAARKRVLQKEKFGS